MYAASGACARHRPTSTTPHAHRSRAEETKRTREEQKADRGEAHDRAAPTSAPTFAVVIYNAFGTPVADCRRSRLGAPKGTIMKMDHQEARAQQGNRPQPPRGRSHGHARRQAQRHHRHSLRRRLRSDPGLRHESTGHLRLCIAAEHRGRCIASGDRRPFETMLQDSRDRSPHGFGLPCHVEDSFRRLLLHRTELHPLVGSRPSDTASLLTKLSSNNLQRETPLAAVIVLG